MASLSVAMIVKNEGKTIERILGCARLFADEMIVVDTGSEDDTVTKATAMGAKVHHFTWISDFAAARNFSFSKCSQDWIIWLDGDDIITPENQQRILDLKKNVLSDELEAIYLRYIYPPFIQWRERMVRRALFGQKLEWREPIHECIHGIDNQKARFFDDIFIQHDTPPERMEQKKDRNIIILRKHIADGANDERTWYIYAVECLHSLYQAEAEEVLPTFFARAISAEYRYEIYCKMYNFYMHFGELKKAVDAVTQAIAVDPVRAEAYYKLGRHIADKWDNPVGATPLLLLASSISLQKYGTPEMEAYTHGPLEALARTHFRQELYDQAKAFARRALEKNPPAKPWLEALAECDPNGFFPEPIAPEWQEWIEGNMKNNIPRHTLIRILEENHFSPGQIITGLQTATERVKLAV